MNEQKANRADKIENIAISAHLRCIEEEHEVKILLAVESGSRAWGFESSNSDWDVRFIYVHNPEWYFKVEEQRDVIEHMYDDDVDLVGWELRKALRLFRRSNPSLLEWFNSPIVYYVNEHFAKRIHEVEEEYFNLPKGRCFSKYSSNSRILERSPAKLFFLFLKI